MSAALGLPWVGLCSWCANLIVYVETGSGGRVARPCGHSLPDLGAVEHHRFALPYPEFPRYPALSPNLRGNRWVTNTQVQAVRADVSRIVRGRIRPPCKHLTVHLAWRPKRLNNQDDDNLMLLFKACCDALARGPRRPTLANPGANIGLDLVPNDTRRYVSRLMPAVLPEGPPGMWLTVIVTR